MPSSTIQDIINTALTREGKGGANTMIVSNHLAQMVLFGIRQGVEFYPAYDPNGERRNFINDLVKRNKLDLYLQAIWESYVGTGSILFYLRPNGNTYDINWYNKSQFEPYYKDGGRELDRVIITYAYQVKSDMTQLEQEKWVRLEITKTEIRRGDYEVNPGLNLHAKSYVNEEVTTNSLGIIPCIIVDNNPIAMGKRGTNDFDWLSGQIEEHNDLMAAINQNIRFFGNPSLVTTRDTNEVTEAIFGANSAPRTMSSGAAFTNKYVPSTYKYDPTSLSRTEHSKIKPVIGGVEPEERFGFIQPDAVSGDQNRWALQYEELIRTALGGVSENGINSGATAFEIKSLFGRAAATAHRKAKALYTYGLCKVFEVAIAAEEHIFERSFEVAVGWDTEKDGAISRQFIDDWLDGFEDQKGKEYPGKPLPPGVIGLRPQGTREVLWRFTGPVFEDGPIDLQQKSIFARNLAEEGFDTISQMQILFPDKTEEEINQMLGGVPFRRISNTMGIIERLAGMASNFGQIPDPLMPDIPLVAKYGQFIDQMIFILFQKMLVELSRGQQDDRQLQRTEPSPFGPSSGIPSDSDGSAGGLQPGPAGQLPYPGHGGPNAPMAGGTTGQRGSVPGAPGGSPAGVSQSGYATGLLDPSQYGPAYGYPLPNNGELQPGPAGAVGQQPFGRGTQQGIGTTSHPGMGTPEFINPIPAPGGTVESSASTAAVYRPQYGNAYQQPVYGESDLQRQPGLLAQLFPTFGAAANAATKRLTPKRRKTNKR